MVRLRGGGFGPSSRVTAAPGTSGRYPYSLAGVGVTIEGIPAPIVAVGPGEVDFAIPFGTATGMAGALVLTASGASSNALHIPVSPAAPFIVGPVFNQDGTVNSSENPAHWGEVITVYLTGGGAFSPPLADGEIAPNDATHRLALPAVFSWTGPRETPMQETVIYAGAAPGSIGLAQLNLLLPPSQPQIIYPLYALPYISVGGLGRRSRHFRCDEKGFRYAANSLAGCSVRSRRRKSAGASCASRIRPATRLRCSLRLDRRSG